MVMGAERATRWGRRGDARFPRVGLRGLAAMWTLVLAAVPGAAAAQHIDAQLDKSATVLGDPVTLTIEVTGGSPGTPQIPNLTDWSVQYAGRQTSFSIVNGRMSHAVGLQYLFTPLKTGSLTIPPIAVPVGGEVLRTPELKVRVVGSRRQMGSPANGQGQGVYPPPATGTGSRVDAGDDVIVEVEVDPPIAYVGQMIRQTLRVYTAVPLGDSIQVSRGRIPGTVEEDNVEASQRRYTATRHQRTYRVEEVSWVFYPVTVGPLVIPPIDVTVPVVIQSRRRRGFGFDPLFDDFFGRSARIEPRGYRTEQKTLVIRPIPETGRPPGYSGLVGTFSVKADLADTQMKLGDSTTVTITVEGRGNLRNLSLDPVKNARVKVYDDSPSIAIHLDERGRVISRKTFKRAVVPQVSGDIELEPIRIVFFDPDAGKFGIATSSPILLHVSPGANGETSLAGTSLVHGSLKKTIQVTGKDILPIHTGQALAGRRTLSIVTPSILMALGAAPGIFFLSVWIAGIRRKRYGDETLRRRRVALRAARSRIKKAKTARDSKEALEHLSKTIRGYLGDKLDLEGGALTAKEVSSVLVRHGVTEAVARDAGRLLDEIENARYAPGSAGTDARDIVRRTENLLKQLEKTLG